jgi:hypothetical protein
MKAWTKSYIDEILDFLLANGASLFGREWLAAQLTKASKYGAPTMILAPSDATLQKLSRATNRTWEEILRLPEGIDILESHLSTEPTSKVYPMFRAINGTMYGSEQADIDKLGISPPATIIRVGGRQTPIVVIVIDTLIVPDEKIAKLKKARLGYSVWQRPTSDDVIVENPGYSLAGTEIPALTKDVFRKLVLEQDVRGQSLLALCTGNTEIAALCDRDDQFLFRQLLLQEFNFKYSHGYAKESPRELYAKLYKYRIEIYGGIMSMGNKNEGFSYYNLVRDNAPIQLPHHLPSRHDRVILPLEGEFAANFSRPVPVYSYLSYSLQHEERKTRSPVYLLYITGIPETATMLKLKGQGRKTSYTPSDYELSNSWFMDYFGQDNRWPLYNNYPHRRYINDMLDLITLLLQGSNKTQLGVKTANGQELWIMFLQLDREFWLKF